MNQQTLTSVTQAPSAIFWFSTVAMSAFFVAAIGATMLLLKRSPTWSIGDALSEEADAQDARTPGQKPVLVASSSRTIALFGMIVLMGAVVGLSYFALWALFYGQSLDELTKLGPLFYGATALFAPYAVNQIRSAVAAVTSTRAMPSGGNAVGAARQS
jgi:hypothetical protein